MGFPRLKSISTYRVVFGEELIDRAAVVGVDLGEVVDGPLLDERLGVLEVPRDVLTQVAARLLVQHLNNGQTQALRYVMSLSQKRLLQNCPSK